MSRKKTIAAHQENGTYRPSVHGLPPAFASSGPSSAPSKPKLGRAASRCWDELVGLLRDRLKPEDAPQLEQLAVWLCQWRQIVARLDTAEPGTLAYTRLVSALSTASKSFDRIGARYGLTPLDRESLNLPAPNNGVRTW